MNIFLTFKGGIMEIMDNGIIVGFKSMQLLRVFVVTMISMKSKIFHVVRLSD